MAAVIGVTANSRESLLTVASKGWAAAFSRCSGASNERSVEGDAAIAPGCMACADYRSLGNRVSAMIKALATGAAFLCIR
ncbi:MAG: hypothetical protein WC829_03625 [Hyphomicrobium sp.]